MNDRSQTNFAQPEIVEDDEGKTVENANLSTLMQVNEAEVNRQILTARAYPRNVTGFRQSLQELVCYDEPTALSCLYALKKGGAPVQGASIRFAEAAFQMWGNARCGSSIIDVGQEWITTQGFYWDLEKNTGLAIQIIRRLTDSKGKRYSEDVIMSTGNAASSIALRNAILKGIPKTAWNPVYLRCRQVSVGASKSIGEQRDNMVKAFAPLNVDKQQIFGLLGVKGMDDVTIDHMIFMAGVLNSIKDGEVTVEQAFALENMTHPDQVKPPQPRRSEFERDVAEGRQADKTPPKDTGKGQEAPKAEDPRQQETPKSTEQHQQSARDPAQLDWIKDAYAELAIQKRVRDVVDLRDEKIGVGVFTDEEEKQWTEDCKAKSDALMAAAKKK